jgi:hypothetical protein
MTELETGLVPSALAFAAGAVAALFDAVPEAPPAVIAVGMLLIPGMLTVGKAIGYMADTFRPPLRPDRFGRERSRERLYGAVFVGLGTASYAVIVLAAVL